MNQFRSKLEGIKLKSGHYKKSIEYEAESTESEIIVKL